MITQLTRVWSSNRKQTLRGPQDKGAESSEKGWTKRSPIEEHPRGRAMPEVQCPIEGCEYTTPDVDPVIAAALITAHATSHRAPYGPAQAARVEKVKRPSISSAGTTEDWQYFKSRWGGYVRATRLQGQDRVIQLLECCDDQLRKDLIRNAGGTLTEMTEEEVFAAMRKLAIRRENTMVARVALHNMKQDRGEPVRAYGARLRGQASVCKFTQQCTGCDATVDYTDAMIKDVLCSGLDDTEIQMDLLGNRNQDMTLEQVLAFVEAKESGKRSASRLLVLQAVDTVASSTYKKQKRPQTKSSSPKGQPTCTYCGNKGHCRNPPTRVRRTKCPAYGTVCNYCGRGHHFEKVCWSTHEGDSPGNVTRGDAVFDTLWDHPSGQPQKSNLRQTSADVVEAAIQIAALLKMSIELDDTSDSTRLHSPLSTQWPTLAVRAVWLASVL